MTTFMFAWSSFDRGNKNNPVYNAVRSDGEIFKSNDWREFFSTTGLFCKDKKIFSKGEFKENPAIKIYVHPNFDYPFIVEGDDIRVRVLNSDDISWKKANPKS